MAIFKKVAKAGKYQDDYAIHNLITYITRPDKTPSQMIGGYGVDPDHIADSMVQIRPYKSYQTETWCRACRAGISWKRDCERGEKIVLQ